MDIIPQAAPRVKRQTTARTPIRTYKPANANVTACVTYHDPALGIVAVTHRSTLGVMRASTAIHFDAGVFDRLVTDGVTWLECLIKDSQTTYRTRVDTMRQYGRLQQHFGLQRVLHLKYWGVNGDEPEGFKAPAPVAKEQPETAQPTLFDLAEPTRKGAY